MRVPIFIAFSALLGSQALAGQGVWTTHGPDGGNVLAMAVDPTSPSIIYASTTSGERIYRSTDGGGSWEPDLTSVFATLPPSWAQYSDAFWVDGIAISHGNPAAIYLTVSMLYAYPFLRGVERTTDGGATWSAAGGNIYSILLDPLSPSVLYANEALERNPPVNVVVKSTDGGATWAQVQPPAAYGPAIIAIDPARSGILYEFGYSADFTATDLLKSTDGGASWTTLDFGLPQYTQMEGLAVDPLSPDTLYAGFAGPTSSGLVKSTDGGSSWSVKDLTPCFATSLAIDPVHEGTLYTSIGCRQGGAPQSSEGVQRSTDGGNSWIDFNAGLPSNVGWALAFNSDGTILHATSYRYEVYDISTGQTPACVVDANTLCLNNGRFEVQVEWNDFQNNSGLASVVAGGVSNNSGLMWFFGPDNWELLIKVLNGCGVNGHYWVFGGAATNVGYTIQVTDTQTGDVRTYTNPAGMVSPAITDTSAFPGCP